MTEGTTISYKVGEGDWTTTVPSVIDVADSATVSVKAENANYETATGSYILSRAAGEKTGSYAITTTGAATQGNYNVTFVPGTLTIKSGSVIAIPPDTPVTDIPESLNSTDHFVYVVGYADGTFKPNLYITRAEAITIINRMLNRGVFRRTLRQ